MEAIAHKSKYVRKESRWQKVRRLLRRFIWVFPLLAIGGGLLIAWFMIQNIQAESTHLPEVEYEHYLTPRERVQKGVKRLDLYREKMKREKAENIPSRYERIISGSELIGRADFGKIITPESPEQDPEQLPADAGRAASAPPAERAPEVPESKPRPAQKRHAPHMPDKLPEPVPAPPADSLVQADSLAADTMPEDPFFTLKAAASGGSRYTRAHFYGDQDILNGTYVRLRLGEDMLVDGVHIPRNTVFRGVASLNRNKIEISIERIGAQAIAGMVCDQDYNPGIVLPASRSGDMEQAVSRSIYQQGTGTAMDLPYEILQDLSQNIIRNKRRKQSIIRINDGYPVYITQTHP